jgi:hypothetical protein
MHYFFYGVHFLPRFTPLVCIFPFLRHVLHNKLITYSSVRLEVKQTVMFGVLLLITDTPFFYSPISRVLHIPYAYKSDLLSKRGRPPPRLAPRIMTTFLFPLHCPNRENPDRYKRNRSTNAIMPIRLREYLAEDRGELIGGVMYPLVLAGRLRCR